MPLIPTLFCPKPWENMPGTDTQRFCHYCQKHVHNLEALSATERLALLKTPAASLCSRYQVAIRRPAKGKAQSYERHLLKYGLGVALTGSVLLVLWEMNGPDETNKRYLAAPHARSGGDMPTIDYDERRTFLLGEMIACNPVQHVPPEPSVSNHNGNRPVEVRIDPVDIEKMFLQSQSVITPPPPVILLK